MSIQTQLAQIDRRLPPPDEPKQRESHHLINVLVSDPEAARVTNKLARLVSQGCDETHPDVQTLMVQTTELVERLWGGKVQA